ncbi:MAG TPA: TerC family protein [Steroidobacteraceae bacterium]|nr:TerC family protein [Steroidobacteraceae bacterium]
MLHLLTDPSAWLSFVTLTVLEIVLGIDNIVFLAILVSRLPPERQRAARIGGLALAMLTRIALLLSITWLIALRAPLFAAFGQEVSSRDLVLFLGGLFLLWKSVLEIHASIEGPAARPARRVKSRRLFVAVIVQIALIDIIFSIDSVFTAVGLAQHVEIMVAAIVIAVLFMMFVARGVSAFIERHPTIKVLALAFLILIGVALIADAFEFHIPKGYLYFAMAFSVGVEMINLKVRGRSAPPPQP